jgi:hypothetical protein
MYVFQIIWNYESFGMMNTFLTLLSAKIHSIL